MHLGDRLLHPAAAAGRSCTIIVSRAIAHLLVAEEVCRFSEHQGRLIPHASSPAGTPCPLGVAVILAYFPTPTVPAARCPNALAPGLGRAPVAAIAVASALAPAAQLKGHPAAAAASVSEIHSPGRAGTRQRPRACASSRPRQRGSTPLGGPVAAGSPVSPVQRRSLRPRGGPRQFLTYRARVRPGPRGPLIPLETEPNLAAGDTISQLGSMTAPLEMTAVG